jgi:DNA (cytosine-5)-methyltransferase 1
VFVVASARDGFDPAAVLFEFDGVRRDSAPSREAGQSPAPTIAGCANGGGLGTDFDCDGGVISGIDFQNASLSGDMAGTLDAEGQKRGNRGHGVLDVSRCLNAKGGAGRLDAESETLIPTIGGGFDGPVPMINMQGSKGNAVVQADGPSFTLNAMHGHDVHAVAVPVAFHPTQDPISSSDVCHAIGTGNGQGCATATAALRGRDGGATAELGDDAAFSLRASSGGGDKPHVMTAMQVRRLTPTECERLQGFPDGYTVIPWRGKPESPDGPRYKAIGNSWAVPVVRWIGRRIAAATSSHPSSSQTS